MSQDESFMRRAIALAKNGEGKTNPNPLVGAVIVKDGKIIGEGFHTKYGELHAEREAINDCKKRGNSTEGSTLYVTLEPCSHYGKQPPCTEAVLNAGIKKVFVGSRDPNPLVHGKGVEFLRAHNICVTEDFLKDECDALNKIFFHFITAKTPYVALKYAMTLDGAIATKTGESKWITNEKSREYVHLLRNKYSSILVGVNTVLKDDPLLTSRVKDKETRNPVRIICDSSLKIPVESKIVQTAGKVKTIVASSECFSEDKKFLEKKKTLESLGVEVLVLEGTSENSSAPHKINLSCLTKELGKKNIDSVLVEGGAEINAAMLEENLVNKVYAFVAPKIFGGNTKRPIGGSGIEFLSDAKEFSLDRITQFESDVLLEYCLDDTF